jgi:hypothetical protein
MFDVIALGELLIDFTPAGPSKQGIFALKGIPEGHLPMYWPAYRSLAEKLLLLARLEKICLVSI